MFSLLTSVFNTFKTSASVGGFKSSFLKERASVTSFANILLMNALDRSYASPNTNTRVSGKSSERYFISSELNSSKNCF